MIWSWGYHLLRWRKKGNLVFLEHATPKGPGMVDLNIKRVNDKMEVIPYSILSFYSLTLQHMLTP